jgi:hypothetical protein
LVQSYNKSFHRSIKTSPNLVNKNNEKKIHQILYGSGKIKKPFFKFKIGEQVRITKYKSIFEKGFTAKCTREIFLIKTLIPREPIVYKLEDSNGEEINGVFYEPELQKVIKDIKEPFVKDKVLKTKTEKGEKNIL